jgi:hypothetical protein
MLLEKDSWKKAEKYASQKLADLESDWHRLEGSEADLLRKLEI